MKFSINQIIRNINNNKIYRIIDIYNDSYILAEIGITNNINKQVKIYIVDENYILT